MGNQICTDVPQVLIKNWQPIPDNPSVFRNKLTLEYCQKHTVKISGTFLADSLKNRMKETNDYICRVLFYSQGQDNIYHVYTDEMSKQITICKSWPKVKIKIAQAFAQLIKNYGIMKVCKQMLKADSNGHPKIWIHPDPLSTKIWANGTSEHIMLVEVLNILNSLQEQKVNNNGKRMSAKTSQHIQYLTFQQYVRVETQKCSPSFGIHKVLDLGNIAAKSHQITNNMDSKSKRIRKVSANVQIPDLSFPRKSNITIDQKVSKNNTSTLIKTQCQTSREKISKIRVPERKSPDVTILNLKKNHSLSKPVSTSYTSSQQRIKKQLGKNQTKDIKPSKRRDTQDFKKALYSYYLYKQQKSRPKSKISKKTRTENSQSQSQSLRDDSNSQSKQGKKNPLDRFFIQNGPEGPLHVKNGFQNRSALGYCNLQQINKVNRTQEVIKKQIKQRNFPIFLQKPHAVLVNDHKKNDIQQPEIVHTKAVKFFRPSIDEAPIKKFSQKQQHNAHLAPQQQKMSKNGSSALKQQLNFILDCPVEPQTRPFSMDYENFKVTKLFYRGDSFQPYLETESDRSQVQIIREKVQNKKMRFAQLKLDALRILQDDI